MTRSSRDLSTFSNLLSVISLSFYNFLIPKVRTWSSSRNLFSFAINEKSPRLRIMIFCPVGIIILMKQGTHRNPKQLTSTLWSKPQLLPAANQTKRQGFHQGVYAPLPVLRQHRIQSRDMTQIRRRKHQMSLINKKRLSMVDDYELRHKIGEGAFAEVHVAVDTRNSTKVVIKTYDKAKLYDKQRKLNIKNEIAILGRVDHPRIIKLIEVIDNARQINLVMEYFSEQSLRKFLNQRQPLSQDETKTIIKQIAQALSFLHSEGLAHRDIKLENILIDEDLNIKIIDFGFAVESHSTAEASIVGTPSYISPELIAGKQYNPFKADIWALGVLLYYIVTGYFPFRGDSKNIYKKISKGQILFPHDINPGCEYLIRKMLNHQYEERIHAQQVLKDTWIKPINFREQIHLLEKAIKHTD